MKMLFSPSPLWQAKGISIIRIIAGFFLIYHGWEIFDLPTMNGYLVYDTFKNLSHASFMVYTGKAGELIAGFLLFIGWLTRLASMAIAVTFLYISFFVGHGKIWYEDQHPFLFVLLAFVFFFTGPGKWSVDNLLFHIKKNITKNIL
jgi:putative oxidoreductase